MTVRHRTLVKKNTGTAFFFSIQAHRRVARGVCDAAAADLVSVRYRTVGGFTGAHSARHQTTDVASVLLQDLPSKMSHRLLRSVTWTEVDGAFPIRLRQLAGRAARASQRLVNARAALAWLGRHHP
jgi:hypothetical protein